MSLGKAAVFKHIPVYYPKDVGAVGGLVGMIGGLGGFVLPIAFGVLNDLTGIWTSCFMLLFAIAVGSLAVDAFRHPPAWSAKRLARSLDTLPQFPEMQPIHEPAKHSGRWRRAHQRLAAGRSQCSGTRRARSIAARNLWLSIPSLFLSFAVWMVWSVVVAKLPTHWLQLHDRSIVLARGAAGSLRRDAAHLLLVHGAGVWRAALDDA